MAKLPRLRLIYAVRIRSTGEEGRHGRVASQGSRWSRKACTGPCSDRSVREAGTAREAGAWRVVSSSVAASVASDSPVGKLANKSQPPRNDERPLGGRTPDSMTERSASAFTVAAAREARSRRPVEVPGARLSLAPLRDSWNPCLTRRGPPRGLREPATNACSYQTRRPIGATSGASPRGSGWARASDRRPRTRRPGRSSPARLLRRA
jgi:hypothetical protein